MIQVYSSTVYTSPLPNWALQSSYSSSELVVKDSYTLQASCRATVAIGVCLNC